MLTSDASSAFGGLTDLAFGETHPSGVATLPDSGEAKRKNFQYFIFARAPKIFFSIKERKIFLFACFC